MTDSRALDKAAVARDSLRFISSGQVIGLGTGSTAAFVIQFLAERVRQGLVIRAIPTSQRTHDLAQQAGIPLTTLDEVQAIDVTIDGADEFDPALNLIKGGGGALLREKIVASASRVLVIVADAAKRVPVLGRFPLPVEVVPFAQALIASRITAMGAVPVLRRDATGRPFVTDEGHHILDCQFERIPDPPSLARTLEAMPGIVEHGLFVGMATVVLVAPGEGGRAMDELRRPT